MIGSALEKCDGSLTNTSHLIFALGQKWKDVQAKCEDMKGFSLEASGLVSMIKIKSTRVGDLEAGQSQGIRIDDFGITQRKNGRPPRTDADNRSSRISR